MDKKFNEFVMPLTKWKPIDMDIVISLTLGLMGNLCMAIEFSDKYVWSTSISICWYQGLNLGLFGD
jgi:hypothetical protein